MSRWLSWMRAEVDAAAAARREAAIRASVDRCWWCALLLVGAAVRAHARRRCHEKVFGPSPRAIAILRIYREEIFGPVMDVAPRPDLTAALALVDTQTTSDRCLFLASVTTPSRRAEGERALPQRAGLW
jgi:hypothetical protein